MFFYLVYYLVTLVFNFYILVLIARALLSWVKVFNPYWYPQNSLVLSILKIIYALTEPPLRFLSRFIRPIQFGSINLDLAYIVLFLIVLVLQKFSLELIFRVYLWLYMPVVN